VESGEEKEMIEPSYIYAFRHAGKILYVGQTVDPETRRFFHRRATASKIRTKLPKGAEFIILRETNTANSFRIERQIICNLKRKGQAALNRNKGCSAGELVGGYRIVNDGLVFASIAQAERFKKGGWPKGRKRKV